MANGRDALWLCILKLNKINKMPRGKCEKSACACVCVVCVANARGGERWGAGVEYHFQEI